jgi:hypothetical protein
VLAGGIPNRTIIQRVVLRGSFALAGDDMEREQVACCVDLDPDGVWRVDRLGLDGRSDQFIGGIGSL